MGPSWSGPTRAHHGAELERSDARAPPGPSWTRHGAELERSTARAHHGAELDAATMAAVLARYRGRVGAVRRARHRGELERSDVRATA